MKVLCTCIPGFGHFHPMVPLAAAFVAAGHEVAFATAERFCRRVIEPAGFLAFAAGPSPMIVHEQALALPAAAAMAEDDVWGLGAHMFAEVAAPAKVPALVAAVEAWGADLVVHDMTDFAGPVAAAATGIPWVNHSFGALQPDEFWNLAAELVEPTWQAWGVEPGPLGGMFRTLYLDVCPPALQSEMIEHVPSVQALRPVTFDNPEGLAPPAWLDVPRSAPTVYVTLGTVANHAEGVFETVLEAVDGLHLAVIVTIGPDRNPDELGSVPANVRVERYLPQSLVFPSCDLVICHGGSGTTLAALGCGLPLLVLPQEANQFWNAGRIAELGAGEEIWPEALTPAAVRAAVSRLLDVPAYRERAGAVASEIAAMPGPDGVVTVLERVAHEHRTRGR